mmetsp:Transcript_22072/g.66323  ORF Transcript_22072/g.66323 Transcript_22072/m.66323 type:complete len:315 (-) Transcript_22072:905-1849(-)
MPRSRCGGRTSTRMAQWAASSTTTATQQAMSLSEPPLVRRETSRSSTLPRVGSTPSCRRTATCSPSTRRSTTRTCTESTRSTRGSGLASPSSSSGGRGLAHRSTPRPSSLCGGFCKEAHSLRRRAPPPGELARRRSARLPAQTSLWSRQGARRHLARVRTSKRPARASPSPSGTRAVQRRPSPSSPPSQSPLSKPGRWPMLPRPRKGRRLRRRSRGHRSSPLTGRLSALRQELGGRRWAPGSPTTAGTLARSTCARHPPAGCSLSSCFRTAVGSLAACGRRAAAWRRSFSSRTSPPAVPSACACSGVRTGQPSS